MSRLIEWAASVLAVIGGLALVAVTLVTVVSIIGRGFVFIGLAPVPGDYELVEIGIAFALFSFLPWCQLRRGHVTVDVLLTRMGGKAKAASQLAGDAVMSVLAGFILWRLIAGLGDKYGNGESTYILEIPVWWGYAASLAGAALFVVTALFTLSASIRLIARRGRQLEP